jgi:rubrerythrin
MDGVGSTAKNLGVAIAEETHEYTQTSPPMLKQAEADGHKAKRMFDYAAKAKAVHARLYQLALEAVQQGKDLPQDKIYLCFICGDLEFGAPPESCPVCKAKGSSFIKVR